MPKNCIGNAELSLNGQGIPPYPHFRKVLQVLCSIGHGLRLIGGALILLVTLGPMVLAPFYWLYFAAINPLVLLNPVIWVIMIFSIITALIAVVTVLDCI